MNNTNRDILCLSTGQNPNDFRVKLPQTLAIYPDTEVALVNGQIQNTFELEVDETNDEFCMLWSAYNALDYVGAVGRLDFDYLPPERFKLKHGSWAMRVSSLRTAGNVAGGLNDQKNILTNLVSTFNEQTKYWMYGLTGAWTAERDIELYLYQKAWVSEYIDWIKPSLEDEPKMTVTTTLRNPGVAVGFNTITSDTTTAFLLSANNVPMPFNSNSVDDTPADVTNSLQQWTLKSNAALPDETMASGGFIFEEQEIYRAKEGYDVKKDWIIRSPLNQKPYNLAGPNGASLRTNMYAGWRRGEDGFIEFFMKQVKNGFPQMDVLETVHVSTTTWDNASADIIIDCKVKMVVLASTMELNMEWYIGGVLEITFNIESNICGNNLRHAYFISENTDVEFSGVDYNGFTHNTPAATIGTTDDPDLVGAPTMGDINPLLVMGPLSKGNRPVDSYQANINAYLQDFTKNCSTNWFNPDDVPILAFDGTQEAGAPLDGSVRPKNQMDNSGLHICIENLPIENYQSNILRGQPQKRIYSKYNETGVYGEVLEPYNPIYHKLLNKQAIYINELQVRICDNQGRTRSDLKGATKLNIHLRTSPAAVQAQMLKAIGGLEQKMESKPLEDISVNMDLAHSVI